MSMFSGWVIVRNANDATAYLVNICHGSRNNMLATRYNAYVDNNETIMLRNKASPSMAPKELPESFTADWTPTTVIHKVAKIM